MVAREAVYIAVIGESSRIFHPIVISISYAICTMESFQNKDFAESGLAPMYNIVYVAPR